MGCHFSQFVAADHALLIDAERVIALFEQGIEPIQDRWIAQICVLKDYPLPLLDGLDQHRVDPFESAQTFGCDSFEITKLVKPVFCVFVQSKAIVSEECLEYADLALDRGRLVKIVLEADHLWSESILQLLDYVLPQL